MATEPKYLAPIRLENKKLWEDFMRLSRIVENRSATGQVEMWIKAFVEQHKDKLPKPDTEAKG
jgi:hypothetical protein